jgi:hypothetical protein
MSWKTWYPFASPQGRDICSNLTPSERAELMQLGAAMGQTVGAYFAVPSSVVAVTLGMWLWKQGVPLWQLLVGYFVLIALASIVWHAWPNGPSARHRQRMRDLLCNSARDRELGVTSETLRLYRFPWSGLRENPYQSRI